VQPVTSQRDAAGFCNRRDQFQMTDFKMHFGLPLFRAA
jgi:hypothetical protein